MTRTTWLAGTLAAALLGAAAAKCLEAGKGVGIGKYCGMKHQH